MLIKFFDDSEPSKIRKSIFIFASIAIFTYFYKLDISAPSAFFSSAATADNKVHISYVQILKVLAAFQLYLLCRLIVSSKISFAIFNKNWKIDEFKEDEDLIKLQEELRNFNIEAKDKIALKDDFHAVISVLDKLVPKQEEMATVVAAACEVSNRIPPVRSELAKILKKENITSSEVFDIFANAEHFNDLGMHSIMAEVNSVKVGLDGMRKSIKSTLSELADFEEKSSNFNQHFPSSNYKAVTEINPKSLINSRTVKVAEMRLFELIVPVAIGSISFLICLNPENTWVSSILKAIF